MRAVTNDPAYLLNRGCGGDAAPLVNRFAATVARLIPLSMEGDIAMRIVLLCATQRGYRFIQRVTELLPTCELVVFSFPEEPWEPRFLDDIRADLGQGGLLL